MPLVRGAEVRLRSIYMLSTEMYKTPVAYTLLIVSVLCFITIGIKSPAAAACVAVSRTFIGGIVACIARHENVQQEPGRESRRIFASWKLQHPP